LLLFLSLLAAKKKNPLLPRHLLLRQHLLLKPQLPPPLMLSLLTLLLLLPTPLSLLTLLHLLNNSMQSQDCILKNKKATLGWLFLLGSSRGGRPPRLEIFTLNRPPAL
jgi:hypothetical protein